MLTYGDGVSNVNIPRLLDFHRQQQKLATMTAVRPPARFGQMVIEDHQVKEFKEKPQIREGWNNGGFFVLSPKVLEYIDSDQSMWENVPIQRLVQQKQLCAYEHTGFWMAMDTMRDKKRLEDLWNSNAAPWKVWDDARST